MKSVVLPLVVLLSLSVSMIVVADDYMSCEQAMEEETKADLVRMCQVTGAFGAAGGLMAAITSRRIDYTVLSAIISAGLGVLAGELTIDRLGIINALSSYSVLALLLENGWTLDRIKGVYHNRDLALIIRKLLDEHRINDSRVARDRRSLMTCHRRLSTNKRGGERLYTFIERAIDMMDALLYVLNNVSPEDVQQAESEQRKPSDHSAMVIAPERDSVMSTREAEHSYDEEDFELWAHRGETHWQ